MVANPGPLHSISEVRIHSVCHVLLSQESTLCLLFFLGQTAGSGGFVAALVLVHVPAAPSEDDGKFEGKSDGTGNGARHVARGVGRLEDERATNISNAVREESQR